MLHIDVSKVVELNIGIYEVLVNGEDASDYDVVVDSDGDLCFDVTYSVDQAKEFLEINGYTVTEDLIDE